MNKEVRQSKIYSYFHGASTVFQQYIVVVGILFVIMGLVVGQTNLAKVDSAREKLNKLEAKCDEIETEYEDLYYTYKEDPALNFFCEEYEEAEIVENDRNTAEKEAYNVALKKYNDADAKVKDTEAALAKTKIGKTLASRWSECSRLYSKHQYRLGCTLGEEATISSYDWYDDEKREYNNALKAYQKVQAEVDKSGTGQKLIKLKATADKLMGEYEALYEEYVEGDTCVFSHDTDVEVAENDKYKAEKAALDEIFAKYEKAYAKVEKAEKKLENLRNGESASQILFPIAGIIIILVGIVMSFTKKDAFDKASCEAAYDEELQIKVEEAKEKALEKLNIVAEQIDKVDPVVLNGIATYESDLGKKAAGGLAKTASVFTYIGTVLLGAVAAAIYGAISLIFGAAFFIPAIGAIALSAFFGYKVYNKFEKDSYINPKEIQKLEKFNPSLRFRLGTDNNVRVSLPAITVYMFGEEQLYVYYQYLDIVTGKIFSEGIREFFYEDIVGVISSQETKKVFRCAGLFSTETVEYLKESIAVVTSGCQHNEAYIVPVGKSLLDTSFVGMRNLIRQKKSDNE